MRKYDMTYGWYDDTTPTGKDILDKIKTATTAKIAAKDVVDKAEAEGAKKIAAAHDEAQKIRDKAAAELAARQAQEEADRLAGIPAPPATLTPAQQAEANKAAAQAEADRLAALAKNAPASKK